jgi:predicted enzyme related to lactoylglutathione lyase
MQNPVSHFEIYADDPGALARFYTSVFDWKVEAMPENDNYKLVQTVDVDERRMPKQPGGINGGIMKRPDPEAPNVINYVSVESLDQSLDRARQLGAKVMKERSAVPGMGRNPVRPGGQSIRALAAGQGRQVTGAASVLRLG